ncbi:hypothetical protein IMAU30044_00030 [Lactobacillus helveticus]|nr:hypothetical protein [Lactobacillus helveticus]
MKHKIKKLTINADLLHKKYDIKHLGLKFDRVVI